MALQYVTCCVHSTAAAITPMVDRALQVSYRTAVKHIGRAALAQVFPGYEWSRRPGLKLRDDWAVSYHRSVYLGRPCYYVRWSAIEFIFAGRVP